MNRFIFPSLRRPKLSNLPIIRPLNPNGIHSPRFQLRNNTQLTPKNDPPPLAKTSSGIFSSLGNPEANKPMFEELALLTPAIIPMDPLGVIRPSDSAARLLNHSALVVERRLEMLNVFLGYEQCNKYVIMDPEGNHVGFLAEEEGGLGTAVKRQFLHTHRAFKAHILDKEGNQILYFERPIRVINGRIKVHNTENENRIVGEVGQIWSPLRRKYELAVLREDTFHQFAAINEPMLSWDFTMADLHGNLIGSINRNFRGFGREIFTDTGQYVLRMDAASPETTNISNSTAVRRFPERVTELLPVPEENKTASSFRRHKHMELVNEKPKMELVERTSAKGLTLDERAVMLATAVSIDFDYFSHTSGGHGMGFWPLWLPGGGSPDPGIAEPGAAEPATPGLGPDGSDPGMYPDSGATGDVGGESNDGGWGGGEQGEEWGQQGPPSEDNPWAPDEPQSGEDEGWGWGGNDRGGGEGGGGGGGGSDWGDWL